MSVDKLPPYTIEYLRGRFERGDIVLFTGAGFSRGAMNRAGRAMPFGAELREGLWKISYPADPFDASATLPDLYDAARSRHSKRLGEFLEENLRANRDTIPAYYETFYSLPWRRIYTLNVDDLDEVVDQQCDLPRELESLSAVTRRGAVFGPEGGRLDVVHLNGRIGDGINGMTFSPPQVAARLGGPETLYSAAAVDLLSFPVVYIGSPLDEDLLWQHIQLRKHARGKDLRRRSFLVLPSLSRPRLDLLEREYHVEHLPMTVEEFAAEIIPELKDAAREGLQRLKALNTKRPTLGDVPRATELAARDTVTSGSEYLLGASPRWNDVTRGLAAKRDIDHELSTAILASLREPGPRPVHIVTGTAGSGKSTVCMRAALAMAATGADVGWLGTEHDISPWRIRELMLRDDAPSVLFLDDADRYAGDLAPLAIELAQSKRQPVIVLIIRSGRVERLADRFQVLKAAHVESVMPLLSDKDIGSLLTVLTENNRLGNLKGMTPSQQFQEFQKRADRQILVAMLEATSGKKLEQKSQRKSPSLVAMRSTFTVLCASQVPFGLGFERSTSSSQWKVLLTNLSRRFKIFHGVS